MVWAVGMGSCSRAPPQSRYSRNAGFLTSPYDDIQASKIDIDIEIDFRGARVAAYFAIRGMNILTLSLGMAAAYTPRAAG